MEDARDAAGAVITDAVISPGHDGRAELVLRVRYENGALGSVTLDADTAGRLMERCGVETAAELRGHAWQQLLPPITRSD